MKAKKDSKREIVLQLTGSLCFIAYCYEIDREFWNHKTFLDNYDYRFVSIGHTRIAKRKTRVNRESGAHDCPEKMMKIDYPHRIEFNLLAGATAKRSS